MTSTERVIAEDTAAAYLAGPSGAQTQLYFRIRQTVDGDSESDSFQSSSAKLALNR